MKILTIIGARPQFIKAAPFCRAIRSKHREILVHTGQHHDANMSDVFFTELDIPTPDYNLGIGGGPHGKMTGQMLIALEDVILREKPDVVVVFGDTNSTLAGSLAAAKLTIPVMHVEAGLRSFNMHMPEEQNRIITDHLSSWLSCPTETAVVNLRREGIEKGVLNTGDIMLDAVLYNYELAVSKHTFDEYIDGCIVLHGDTNRVKLQPGNFYLATIHRAENASSETKLSTIMEAFRLLDMPVLWPVHPRNLQFVSMMNNIDNVIMVEPVGYFAMLTLIKNAHMLLTDSGGVQKEALFLGTPCVTLRDQTEWVETLYGGWNVLSVIDVEHILGHVHRNIDYNDICAIELFGDGTASQKIVSMLM